MVEPVETQAATPLAPIMVVDGWVWLRRNIRDTVDPETGQTLWVAEEVSYQLGVGEPPPTEETFTQKWLTHTENTSLQAQIDDLNAALIEIAGLL